MGKGKPAKGSKPAIARRLPSGAYAYRGKARTFSELPKREQSRFRGVWATRAAATREEIRAETFGREPAAPIVYKKPRKEYARKPIPTLKIRRGEDPGLAISRLAKENRDQRASPVATLRWADGKVTRVSLPFDSNNAANQKGARDWLRQIESTGGENLRGDKGSKGKGRPKVTEIAWITGDKKKRRNQKRREERIDPDEREAIAYYMGLGMSKKDARAEYRRELAAEDPDYAGELAGADD